MQILVLAAHRIQIRLPVVLLVLLSKLDVPVHQVCVCAAGGCVIYTFYFLFVCWWWW